jgi:[acyl-carrier-protein] S-malonyltransferase
MAKIAYLFPGQGSQTPGMGAQLAERYRSARQAFETADRILPELWGNADVSLRSLCFDGPEDTLRQTIYAQPALYTTSAAAFFALREAGVPGPTAVAGHSVGEYAALLAAGVFDFETGLRLVTRRAQEMQKAAEASSGTMAAVLGLAPEILVEVCEAASAQTGSVVDAANFNSPAQIVISGEVGAVEVASAMAKERGAKRVVPLSVSGAFHSRLMTPAAEAMQSVLGAAEFKAPSISVIANLTADYATTADQARSGLVAQIDHPVRWHESMEKLVAEGYDVFVEVGHGNVLSGMIKRLAPDATILQAGTPEDVEKVIQALA